MLNTWNKLRSWVSFEIYSPMNLPWSWHVESGHCYKLARLSPSKHYVRSTLELTWHLESWEKIHPPPQKQYLEHMRAILSLSHFSIYPLFNLLPIFRSFKAICSKMEERWHVESLLQIYPPSTLQNNTFIVCGKLPRGAILKIYHPLEPSKPYGRFNIWRKLTCWVIAIDLSSGPLQNTLFNIWTNMASWVMFEMSFPSPTTKQDVERTKLEPRVMFGIYAHWTLQINTFNIWIKLTCWFILLDLPALSPAKHYV